jgi:flagellar motor protein MotB
MQKLFFISLLFLFYSLKGISLAFMADEKKYLPTQMQPPKNFPANFYQLKWHPQPTPIPLKKPKEKPVVEEGPVGVEIPQKAELEQVLEPLQEKLPKKEEKIIKEELKPKEEEVSEFFPEVFELPEIPKKREEPQKLMPAVEPEKPKIAYPETEKPTIPEEKKELIKIEPEKAPSKIPLEEEKLEEEVIEPDTYLYIIEKTDNLWKISKEYLGNPLRYKEIAALNNIGNPDLIYPFDKLIIPHIPCYLIYFASASIEINQEGRRLLDSLAKKIKKEMYTKIRIEGHTDSIPIHTPQFPSNQVLSEKRAESVADYLIHRHKIPPHIFECMGYGSSKPIMSNKTPKGRAYNRRAEIIILY